MAAEAVLMVFWAKESAEKEDGEEEDAAGSGQPLPGSPLLVEDSEAIFWREIPSCPWRRSRENDLSPLTGCLTHKKKVDGVGRAEACLLCAFCLDSLHKQSFFFRNSPNPRVQVPPDAVVSRPALRLRQR